MARDSREQTPEQGAALLFASLGDALRLHLLTRMSEHGPLSIAKLTADTQVSRQAVTKHLQLMERAGIVHSARAGRETVWHVDRQRVEDARHYLGLIAGQWDAALEHLRAFVED